MNNTLLIKGGWVIDPANKINGVMDVFVEGDVIKEVSPGIKRSGVETVDVRGKYVCPGFIDMHTHLREPGRGDEETIETAGRAAACGGFTSILCMPNTEPPIDNEGLVEFVYKTAKEKAVINVYCAGCITKRREGRELVEMDMLKKAGAVALSDDGNPVCDSGLMRRALEYSSMCSLRIITHPEDMYLSRGGSMNEGYISTVLGLAGVPSEAEDILVYREIALSRLTRVPVHIAHVSTAESVSLIRQAKKQGIGISCETAPHYFTLTEKDVKSYDTNCKVNPPLRSEKDRDAVIEGILDGTIDVIASDHAPHADYEKELEFKNAPCGIIGLETEVGIGLDRLVHKNGMGLEEFVSKFTSCPAGVLNMDKGTLSEGACADITILDTEKVWTVDPAVFMSKSRNTPFAGYELKGAPFMTIVSGRIIYR